MNHRAHKHTTYSDGSSVNLQENSDSQGSKNYNNTSIVVAEVRYMPGTYNPDLRGMSEAKWLLRVNGHFHMHLTGQTRATVLEMAMKKLNAGGFKGEFKVVAASDR